MSHSSENTEQLSASKQVLVALKEAKSKIEALEKAKVEPIAIVGMACRFPGGANTPEKFWSLLADGIDAIKEIPAQRWDVNTYYDPNPDTPGKMYTRYGGFLDDIDQFDPQFFSISPREANNIDPQHRLLLEVSWEALENAGQVPERSAGSLTGVFVGITGNEYGYLIKQAKPHDNIGIEGVTGLPLNAAAGRISYTFGLTGPCMAIDTACSSSLVAIHQACQSLRQQECNMALAGGVNLFLLPDGLITTSQARMSSPSSRCKTFDDNADGTAWGEGCGMLVLKRLSDAIDAQDHILCVIRGSAVNQDGSSSGFTVPNSSSQQKVIRQALKMAKVKPSQVSYVEAHGTATSLGDPIELRSLAAVFAEERDYSLIIGSVKTNIGHLASAAGISSVIKTILQLQHKQIVPHLHLQQPTSKFDWQNFPIVVANNLNFWEANAEPRIAGVSSFGGSGTNAHLVLEEAPILQPIQQKNHHVERPVHLLTISTHTEKALSELIDRYHHYLLNNTDLELADICHTANTGRVVFKHRLAIIANNHEELAAKLLNFQENKEVVGLFSGQLSSTTRPPKVTFLFTGQGSQYVNMGKELYQVSSVFRETINLCDRLLKPLLEHSLLEIIYPELINQTQETEKLKFASLLDQTAFTQPAIFAIEYALVQLWKSWGIKPDVVMGHSVGEYVAATVAGVFSLEDGLKLVAHRGRLMQSLPSDGCMVAVMASESKVTSLIQPDVEKVSIAAINSPESLVISGDKIAVAAIVKKLELQGIKTKRLQVSHAFHSPLMQPILADFKAVAAEITYHQPLIPLFSLVTGDKVDNRIIGADYWVNHLSQPVRFARGMESLYVEGNEIFLEIGSKPILLAMGRECLPDGVGVWLPSLSPAINEWQQMLTSLAQLYIRGVKIDWSGFDGDSYGVLVPSGTLREGYRIYQKVVLPNYPFQRQRCWVETQKQSDFSKASQIKLHPLINKKFHSPLSPEIFFESDYNKQSLPFLTDHIVYEKIVVAGACHISLLLGAASLTFPTEECRLKNIAFTQALAIFEDGGRTLQLALTPKDTSYSCQLISFDSSLNGDVNYQKINSWAVHVTAIMSAGNQSQSLVSLAKIKSRCPLEIDSKKIYQSLWDREVHLGKSFRWITEVWLGEREVLSQIEVPPTVFDAAEYQLHPGLIDSCFQSIVSVTLDQEEQNNDTFVPFRIEEFIFYNRPHQKRLWCHAKLSVAESASQEQIKADLELFTENGQLIAQVIGLEARKASSEILLKTLATDINDWFYEVEWRAKGRFGKLLPSAYLLTPLEIKEQLTPNLRQLLSNIDFDAFLEIQNQLDALSLEYIIQTLQKMGWSYQPGEHFSTETAVQLFKIVPTQIRLFERILQILAEAEIVEFKQEVWQIISFLETVNPRTKNQTLLHKYPEAVAELTLLDRCASQLSEVLTGLKDPVQLVFPQGDLSTASQFYQNSPASQMMNEIVQQAIAKAIENCPKNRGIRILEIGAGTGGTTNYVLPHLNPNQTEYVFTDIGVLFTAKAREKFSNYPFVRYQTLDIEAEPVPQGFDSGNYDLIIAANVLHATTAISDALDNVKKLLAPEGLLVLLEGTKKVRWVDLIFGLLEGWWKFKDFELRPDYPLLTASKWQKLLKQKGFNEVVSLPEIEGMPEVASRQTVIIAKAEKTEVEPISYIPKRWLIFADNQGVAQKLATQLSSLGQICTLVFAGEKYQKIAPETFIINPEQIEEFEQVIANIIASSTDIYGVVQCWTTEIGVTQKINADSLEKLSRFGCGTTLFLLQTLVKMGLSPRLWLITCGSQAVTSVNPVISGVSQSSIWGMGKAISLEHPELNCVQIDLDPNQNIEEQASALCNEIWSEDRETQVALRDDARYVARLVRSNQTQSKIPFSFNKNNVYLITGAFGGLGLLTAHWLVERGAKHLVLVGQRSPDDSVHNKLIELEKAGAEIVIEIADVSDLKSLTKVFANIEKSHQQLAGVIHAAGRLSDAVLTNQSWSSFQQVMAAKVQGGWNLHQLTQNHTLEFFVLFSSVASLLGSPGQGNHCAANAFLDSLAHYRQKIGQKGLSIHWGAITEVGEAAERGTDIRAKTLGMGTISPDQFLESLERIISRSSAEVAVMPIDWSRWQEKVSQWSFLEDWKETKLTFSGEFKSDFLQKLKCTIPSERRKLLVVHIRDQVAQVLGINDSASISLEEGFFDLGMDSLTSVELRNKLQASLGFSIPPTLAFDYPNVSKLADYFLENLVFDEEQLLDSDSFLISDSEKDLQVEGIAKKLAQQLGTDWEALKSES